MGFSCIAIMHKRFPKTLSLPRAILVAVACWIGCIQEVRAQTQEKDLPYSKHKKTHAGLWRTQLKLVDEVCKMDPPAYKELCSWSGRLQNCQRPVGRMLSEFALGYALSEEKRYLDAACKWALASCNYPTWGLGDIDGTSLSAADQLIGLSFLYDWCCHDLDKDTLKVVRRTLLERGARMFEEMASGRVLWHERYFTGHFADRTCSIGMAGFALCGETEDASAWIGYALDKFKKASERFSDDGASFEGVAYSTMRRSSVFTPNIDRPRKTEVFLPFMASRQCCALTSSPLKRRSFQ